MEFGLPHAQLIGDVEQHVTQIIGGIASVRVLAADGDEHRLRSEPPMTRFLAEQLSTTHWYSMEPARRVLLRDPLLLIACLVGLITLKAVVLLALARLYRLSWSAGIEMALLLAPAGEFAFVGIGLAVTLGILTAGTAGLALAVTTLSMAMIPLLLSLIHISEPTRPY